MEYARQLERDLGIIGDEHEVRYLAEMIDTARSEALEAAAVECEYTAAIEEPLTESDGYWGDGCLKCASNIRALKQKTEGV